MIRAWKKGNEAENEHPFDLPARTADGEFCGRLYFGPANSIPRERALRCVTSERA